MAPSPRSHSTHRQNQGLVIAMRSTGRNHKFKLVITECQNPKSVHTPRIGLSCVRSSKIILAHAFPVGYLSVLWVWPSGILTFLSAPCTRPYSPNTKFLSVLLPAYSRILRISVRFGTRHLSHMSGVLGGVGIKKKDVGSIFLVTSAGLNQPPNVIRHVSTLGNNYLI